ncbi:BatD family protein [Thalassotalea sp. PLHSN55]|uniref:BatD family protein n=1 Tax=Thalassotalea sp. PLHSN55 TaxID=3435888 RepID=UPI003F87BF54
MVRVLFCLLSLTLLSPSWAASQATASVDKNPVRVKESFILNVVVDDSVDNNALDTSPLGKDFIVQRTTVSSQTSMVNFNTTRTTRFQTVLFPRKSGTVIIPPLNVDGLTTDPITLTVLEANENSSAAQQDVFITSDISAKEVYVQQQFTLTVKLHFAVELRRGSMTEPSLINANILQIGEDKESQDIINGRRYRIIERTYAISPQQSGDFNLQTPVFSGEVMVQSPRRSNFLSFGDTKPVSVIGDEIAIKVKAKPQNYQGAWLPSELLTLHEEWQPEFTTFTVGEPITRTVTLTAAGLSQEQLPSIEMNMPDGIKVYPDQAELHTGMNRGRMVSQQVKNFALVASKPGEYQLPELSIPWWNTVTNSYQVAKIAAQTITVLPNPELDEAPVNTSNTNSDAQNAEPVIVTVTEASWLQWLFLALWLLTSFAWFISAKFAKRKLQTSANNAVSAKTSKKQKVRKGLGKVNSDYLALLAACKQQQGQHVLSLLVPWVNSLKRQPEPIASIDEAIVLINDEAFSQAVNELQKCYFGKTEGSWQSDNLLRALAQINNTPAEIKPQNTLNLNP